MENTDRFSASQTEDGRYRLLVEGITDYAIYMLSPEGFVSSWNAGAQRFKGYQAAEIIGRHFSEFYTENDRATGLPARALNIAATEGKFEAEGWRVRKDGTQFWAYVVIDAIRTPSGDLIGFAKITRDLTEHRKTEEQLRRSQEQFRLLVQGVTDYAIYMLTPDGFVSSWNAGAQRIKGYRPEEIIGSHFSRFYTEEDRANGEPAKALATATRDGRFEKEGLRVRKDGSRFWVNVIIDAIRNDDGTIIGFAKITRDVTQQKEAQKNLELARESLMQAQKMDSIGQLTGGVAHDFNNLLMAITGSLDLLRKRLPDDPKMHALIDNAVLGARRGTALTQRMLAFARRQELKVESVDIPDLVRGMSDLLDRSLDPSTSIEIHFPLKLAPAETDTNQLELALLNLVVNARDAMPNGGTIVIAAKEVAFVASHATDLPSGKYICLSVTDTGEGMDAATLARAAEPFFTTKGIGKGTGLGLPIVHGVAAQSGGRLLLHSRKGRGTTAELWLRLAKTAPVPKVREDETAAVTPMRSLVVIAVDDDSLVLSNTVAMLEDLGHRVLQAVSGAQAIDILEKEDHVDLVVTDHAMPNMTGAELAETIVHRWAGLPVIIATGYAELPPGTAAELPKLAKPFDQQELARAINLAVDIEKLAPSVVPFRKR
jgi:PAS domain S-box-containing protein